MTNPIGSCVWAECPYCGMQFCNWPGDIIGNHVIECAKRKQQDMHPEVLDLDQLELEPEAPDDHTSHK